MQRSWRPSSIRSERGVALVEFALVLPLLLLLLIGMVDFGRAFTYWIDETHLANEAARMAAVNKVPTSCTAPCDSIEEYVENQAWAPEVQVSVYLLEGPDPLTKGKAGEALCVRIRAGTHLTGSPPVPVYRFMEFLNLGADKTLKAHSVMRIEREYKGDGTDAYTSAPGAIPSECT